MTTDATQYTLFVQNRSTEDGDVCVYQQMPGQGPDIMSLAWFAKECHQGTNLEFTWGIDYSLFWSDSGQLKPGVLVSASQSVPADLMNSNEITLTYLDGGYEFKDQRQGPTSGTLYIDQDLTIPPNSAASVGIGMGGANSFAIQAYPGNMAAFTPDITYWITLGTYTQTAVMDISEVTDPPTQVIFPTGIYSMTAVYSDGQWRIDPTPKRARHPEAV